MLFPLSMRDPTSPSYNEETAKKYDLFVSIWSGYHEIWKVLIDAKSMTKEAKASKVETLAEAWRVKYSKAFTNQKLYPHILCAHMGDFIRKMPVDPFYL